MSNVPFLYNITSAYPEMPIPDTGFIGKHQDLLFVKQDYQLEKYLPRAPPFIATTFESLDAISEHNADIYSPWARTNGWRANEVSSKTAVDFQGEQYPTTFIKSTTPMPIPTKVCTCKLLRRTFTSGAVELSATSNAEQDDSERALLFTVDGHRMSANLADEEQTLSLFLNDIALHLSETKPDLGLDDDTQHGSGFTAPMNVPW